MIKRCDECIANVQRIEKIMIEFKWPFMNYIKTKSEYFNDLDSYAMSHKTDESKLFENLEEILDIKSKIS